MFDEKRAFNYEMWGLLSSIKLEDKIINKKDHFLVQGRETIKNIDKLIAYLPKP